MAETTGGANAALLGSMTRGSGAIRASLNLMSLQGRRLARARAGLPNEPAILVDPKGEKPNQEIAPATPASPVMVSRQEQARLVTQLWMQGGCTDDEVAALGLMDECRALMTQWEDRDERR